MLVYKKWRKYSYKYHCDICYEGVFLFGIIPIFYKKEFK